MGFLNGIHKGFLVDSNGFLRASYEIQKRFLRIAEGVNGKESMERISKRFLRDC